MAEHWEDYEIEILKELYPDRRAIQKKLITRSINAITSQAYKLGLSDKKNNIIGGKKLQNRIYSSCRQHAINKAAGLRVNQFKGVDLNKYKQA
jgi:hypothetical protein